MVQPWTLLSVVGRRSSFFPAASLALFLLFLFHVSSAAQRKKPPENRKSTSRSQQLQPGSALSATKIGPVSWLPPNIDDGVPPVSPHVPCSLPEVIQHAGERVKELVSNLEQFTAIEKLEHAVVSSNGTVGRPETVSFKYLFSMHEVRPGHFSVEETRDGLEMPPTFPKQLATRGLPAFALIFHPFYRDDFSMACEGLGTWRGLPAWQIRFAQRPDRFPRIRTYQVGTRRFGVRLKGRAWIAADSSQVLSLESDLLEPIPEIKLQTEHLSIEYRPVDFPKRKVQLWLPERAELHVDSRGSRYIRRHSFSEYLLFAVDLRQQIEDPTEAPDPPPPNS